jgi:hypothetical protein
MMLEQRADFGTDDRIVRSRVFEPAGNVRRLTLESGLEEIARPPALFGCHKSRAALGSLTITEAELRTEDTQRGHCDSLFKRAKQLCVPLCISSVQESFLCG